METACNSLEKLNPPPFVTVPISDNTGAKVGQKRRQTFKGSPNSIGWTLDNKIKYASYTCSLRNETDLLIKYIQRKGTQLRLEKALLLTRQVAKVSSRWFANEFHPQLVRFKDGFPHKAKVPKNAVQYVIRVPSFQWLQWIIYLVLREVALLAKIKLECENTVRYWFGLISSSHHWGDSLVAASVLARIWHLSSVMVQELDSVIYPFLYKLSKSIKPLPFSAAWPNECTKWEIPKTILVEWLEEAMGLPFEPANMNRNLSSFAHGIKYPALESVLERSSISTLSTEASSQNDPNDSNYLTVEEDENEVAMQEWAQPRGQLDEPEARLFQPLNDDDEDFGTVVLSRTNLPKAKAAKKIRKGKGLKTKSDTANKKSNNNQAKQGPKRKAFRLHWKKFFKNVPTHLSSEKGRKQMLKRIKSYKLQNQKDTSIKESLSSKIRVKLVKISKNVRNFSSEDDYEKCLTLFTNFQSFIQKQGQKNKKI